MDHASYEALLSMGDVVITGNTGTNLCDFNVLYIDTQEERSQTKDIHARALIDCKGKPLLEVNVITEDGIMGCGASPSGISA